MSDKHMKKKYFTLLAIREIKPRLCSDTISYLRESKMWKIQQLSGIDEDWYN